MTKISTNIELGRTYKDRYSGWEGTAVAIYAYVNGCIRIELAASDKDGKPEAFVFDEQQLDALDVPKVEQKSRRTGGPQTHSPVAR